MEQLISVANGSASSLYGCISYAVQELIMSKFPENYFKYHAISSELASRNIRRTFGTNTNTEMVKRERPYIFIQPVYSAADPDGALQGIPLTKNFNDLQYRVDKGYLFLLSKDPKYGYNIRFKMNRDKVEFDVTIVTATLHAQLDLYKSIQNQMLWEHSFAHRIALESVIPKPLIAIASKMMHMDLEMTDDYIPMVLNRLNACSQYPVTYKMRNASATDEWYMYYTHNIILTFTDLQIESGERKGMVENNYPITFRVTAEFNLPGTYFIDAEPKYTHGLDLTLVSKDYKDEDSTFIPICTINNFFTLFPKELNGLEQYASIMFKCESVTTEKEERVNLRSVLDDDHYKAITIHRTLNMEPSTLLDAYVIKNREVLKYGDDFYIDFDSNDIVIFKPDKSATYRCVIYFNFQTVNELLTNINYDNYYDTNKLRENLVPEPVEHELEDPPTPVTPEEPDTPTDTTEESGDSEMKYKLEVPMDTNPYENLTIDDIKPGMSAADIHNAPLMKERVTKEESTPTTSKKFSFHA